MIKKYFVSGVHLWPLVCSPWVCLDSFLLPLAQMLRLPTGRTAIRDSRATRWGLAPGLCWLLAGGACVCQPVPGAVGRAGARHSPISAQSGGSGSPEQGGLASGWEPGEGIGSW